MMETAKNLSPWQLHINVHNDCCMKFRDLMKIRHERITTMILEIGEVNEALEVSENYLKSITEVQCACLCSKFNHIVLYD